MGILNTYFFLADFLNRHSFALVNARYCERLIGGQR